MTLPGPATLSSVSLGRVPAGSPPVVSLSQLDGADIAVSNGLGSITGCEIGPPGMVSTPARPGYTALPVTCGPGSAATVVALKFPGLATAGAGTVAVRVCTVAGTGMAGAADAVLWVETGNA